MSEPAWTSTHPHLPDAGFDGGSMDCGNGLLLEIRRHLNALEAGGLLEIRSTEPSVAGDLPSWSRLTGNMLVSRTGTPNSASYIVCKGAFNSDRRRSGAMRSTVAARLPGPRLAVPSGSPVPLNLPPLAVTGVGSWPRPAWMLHLLTAHLEDRLPPGVFAAAAADATRLAVADQIVCGVDLVTDGEQSRDTYAGFVGSRLGACRLIPLEDLAAHVEHPEEFRRELSALDVPPGAHHPVALGRLVRDRELVVPDLRSARASTAIPVKIALPGPYLLARTLWLDCLLERHYKDRETLADDVCTVLRDEITHLLAEGAAIVQLDEPVLTEVVHGAPAARRSFMCGALSERREPAQELAFALDLWRRVTDGLPREHLALHVCRGNWSADESVALSGPYTPLLETFSQSPFGTLFLEMATPRAGALEDLSGLPSWMRLGIGLVNQKLDQPESVPMLLGRIRRAAQLFGPHRILLNPDCGFATFATCPLASREAAMRRMQILTECAQTVRGELGI